MSAYAILATDTDANLAKSANAVDAGVVQSPAKVETPATSPIPNGIFTVLSPTGESRTFRIRTWKYPNGKAETTIAKRSIGLLTGSDNENDYTDFAFVDGGRLYLWRRFPVDGEHAKFCRLFEDLFLPESRYRAKGMTVRESRQCLRCNKTLTTPESLASGFGPVCDGNERKPREKNKRVTKKDAKNANNSGPKVQSLFGEVG